MSELSARGLAHSLALSGTPAVPLWNSIGLFISATAFGFWDLCGIEFCILKAVSYTHLDVYKRQLLYKSMGLKDKLPQMSEDEMLKLLATDGMLVKRPLLVGDDFVLVGFKETEWESRLKK